MGSDLLKVTQLVTVPGKTQTQDLRLQRRLCPPEHCPRRSQA